MSWKVAVLTTACLFAGLSGSFADEPKLDTSDLAAFNLSVSAMKNLNDPAVRKTFLAAIVAAAFPTPDKMSPAQAMAAMTVEMGPSPELIAAMKPLNGMTFDQMFAAIKQSPSASAMPAATATPPIIQNVTLADIQKALQDDGYKAVVSKGASGDYVSSATGGESFLVSLDACGDSAAVPCAVVVFASTGQQDEPPMTLDELNALNDKDIYGWGTTYKADDGRYYLTYRASLAGGVTETWIQSTAERYGKSLQKFASIETP
jgi:hypothetical protein